MAVQRKQYERIHNRSKLINMRVTQEEYDYIKAFATSKGWSLAMILEESLNDYIKKQTGDSKVFNARVQRS